MTSTPPFSEFVLVPSVDWRRVERVNQDEEAARRIIADLYAATTAAPEDIEQLEDKRTKLAAFLQAQNLNIEVKGIIWLPFLNG